MVISRFMDPAAVSKEEIAAAIAHRGSAAVQFGKPGYTPMLLEQLNQYCRDFGADLEIRFYAHYWQPFDASVLRHLRDVANLSLDALRTIVNVEVISELSKLTRLHFGVYEFDDRNFLNQLDLSQITQLSLSENAKRNFDLAPLASASQLEKLFIQGHSRSIESISGLPRLTSVSLSGFPKQHDLAFLNALSPLRKLLLLLGSRQSIAELSHPALQELSIIWVRYLDELGPLGRFEALKKLKIEDQLRLRTIDVSGLNLQSLRLVNCKQLEKLIGLEEQLELKDLFAAKTKLDFDKSKSKPRSSRKARS